MSNLNGSLMARATIATYGRQVSLMPAWVTESALVLPLGEYSHLFHSVIQWETTESDIGTLITMDRAQYWSGSVSLS